MDSAWLRCVVIVLAGCGPAVSVEDEDAGSTGGEEEGSTSSSESAPATTASTSTTTSTSTSTSDGSSSESTDGSSSSSSGDDPIEQLCREDGEFAATVSGTNQNDHEGRLVWVSGVEPDVEAPPGAPDPIVLHMEASIDEGAFEITCPMGLVENTAYPSIAVIIDADDNGECSDGDLAFVTQLFAWLADERYSFDGETAYGYSDGNPWLITEAAWAPVAGLTGFDGSPLCDYYIP
jgi:hypothetical protein